MKIAIDLDRLVFLPIKHEDPYVCADLIWIECAPEDSILLDSLGEQFLSGMNDIDAMVLYRHTTGQPTTDIGKTLRAKLNALAEKVPVREVNKYEVDMQAGKVKDPRSERYLYQKGRTTPKKVASDYQLPGVIFSDLMAEVKQPAPGRSALTPPWLK